MRRSAAVPVDAPAAALAAPAARDRSWMLGFAMETGGFALYAAALALASLALVQSSRPGGSAYSPMCRHGWGPPAGRQVIGVVLSVGGLLALAVSLASSSGEGGRGSTAGVLAWLGGTAALAGIALLIGRRTGGLAVAEGIAGGLLFSIGDILMSLPPKAAPVSRS